MNNNKKNSIIIHCQPVGVTRANIELAMIVLAIIVCIGSVYSVGVYIL